MDLRQLEYLVAVAEEANFTRAAARVHITQSGVSAQIRQLERELGADLFDRSGRTATLTAAGAAAVDHARAALASAAAVRRAVDDVNEVVRGRLVVGMVTGCTITPLFDALASFHQAHPGVEVALVEDSSDRLVADVLDGRADVALVGVPALPVGLDALTIVSEPLVAAVGPDHPLARRRRIDLSLLCEHPVVCLPRGTGIRAVFDAACSAAGLAPDVTLQASAPDAVIDLARRGFGAAVVSRSMTAGLDDDLRTLTVDGLEGPALLAFVWRPGTPAPAARQLLARCRTAFGLPA